MRTLIFLMAVTFCAGEEAGGGGQPCNELVHVKPHPIDCCTYPALFDSKKLHLECRKECAGFKGKFEMCVRACELSQLGVYEAGRLVLAKFRNLFVNGKAEGSGQEATQESGVLDEEWTPIFDDSLKHCAAEQAVKEGEKLADSEAVDAIFNLINCVRRHNFVACPRFSDGADCGSLRDRIKTCSKATEKYLFGVFLERRKKDQMDERPALKGRRRR